MTATILTPAEQPTALDRTHTFPPSFHLFQAEAFVGRFRRCGAAADLDAEYRRWADSKDFSPRDRSAIALQVRDLLAQEVSR